MAVGSEDREQQRAVHATARVEHLADDVLPPDAEHERGDERDPDAVATLPIAAR